MGSSPPGRVLELADQPILSTALGTAEAPPAEYAFANLYVFRDRHQYRIAEAPVRHLSGLTYDGLRHALPLEPIDHGAADALLAVHDCLFPFGAEGIALADRLGLECRFEQADSDYIYDGARLAQLTGAKVRRSQARAFEVQHAPSCTPATAEDTGALDAVLEGWLHDVGRSAADTDMAECHEAIALRERLALDAVLVRLESGEPVAFLLASRRGDGEHVVHFAKGRRAHSAAYPWMFARYAATSGALRLNFEQDLGNPGFAQSKQSYAPVERRAKYRLVRP